MFYSIPIEGKQIFIHFVKNESKINEYSSEMRKNEKWKKQEESLNSEEDIAESGRIFIRNLSYTSSEQELQALFEKYGKFIFSRVILLFFFQILPTVCILYIKVPSLKS